MSSKIGRWIALAGVVLIVATVVGGYLMAPAEAGDANESILVGVQGPTHHGKVAKVGGEDEWTLSNAASYHSVSRLQNGSILASFVVKTNDCASYQPPCGQTGVRIIEPEPTPHVVWQWSYRVRSVDNSEVHDAEILPSGNIVIADMDRESIFIIDPQTGDRVWTWNASQHYDAPSDPTTTDWLHINDVDRIGEGRFLVSVRNANQLVIVERGEGVVEVVNEDSSPKVLRKQHNPQWLGKGRILVADSENNRIVELHKRDGEWVPVWSVEEANGIDFSWPRDADRLPNGNTLITDSRNHRVVEIDENGDVVRVWRTPKLPYEADLRGGERVGGPTNDPEAAMIPGTGGNRIPIVGRLTVGLQHAWGLPYWMTEVHVLLVMIGVVLMNFGAASELWDVEISESEMNTATSSRGD